MLVKYSGWNSQSFDALNRIRKAQYPQDLDGQRKEMIPKYNKGGALLALKVDSTDYVKEVAYNARGQRILIAMGNNIMTRYAYDPETFRVLRQRSALYKHSGHTYSPNAGIRQDLQYTYDLEGTITTTNDAAPANTYAQGPGNLLRKFNHDPLRRLISATGREISNVYSQLRLAVGFCASENLTAINPALFGGTRWDLNIRPEDYTATNTYTRSYQYDELGNIQYLSHKAAGHANQDFDRDYTYDGTDNQLKAFTVNSNLFQNKYDGNGNLAQEGQSRFYEWTANDKMAVFKNQAGGSTPSVYTNYFYNAQGERIKKHTRKGNKLIVTFYMDGGMFETSYVKPTGGNIDNNRFYNTIKIEDEGALIATLRVGKNVDDKTPAIKYIVGDHLNNSTAVLKTTGTLINREEFYPFGETSFGGFQYKRYRYNGKEKDEESGLYEYGQRYYAPWVCRFVSVDPVAEDYPHLSSYNYASNRPVTSVDAEGLQTPDEEKQTKSTPATYSGLFQNNKTGTIVHGTYTNKEAKAKNLTVLVGVDSVMAKSDRSPGLAEDGTSIAPDMTYGDGQGQRDFMLEHIDNYKKLSKLSDTELFDNLFDLMETVSKGEMETNNRMMINHFRESSGQPYSSSILSNEVREHPSYQRFLGQIQTQIQSRLQSSSGDVRSLQNLDLVGHPRFNENTLFFFGDRFGGLTFALNDTWAYNVELLELTKNKNEYTGKFNVAIYDHFGLDREDIEEFGEYEGFGSWYILQHDRGYKPFITIIQSTYSFKFTVTDRK